MKEVLRCTSLAPLAVPLFCTLSNRAQTEGLVDYQGRAGIISIVPWGAQAFRSRKHSQGVILERRFTSLSPKNCGRIIYFGEFFFAGLVMSFVPINLIPKNSEELLFGSITLPFPRTFSGN